MKCLAVTDTYTIKSYGANSENFIITNYHTLDKEIILGEDAEIFNLELDNVFNDAINTTNKLDILCGKYV